MLNLSDLFTRQRIISCLTFIPFFLFFAVASFIIYHEKSGEIDAIMADEVNTYTGLLFSLIFFSVLSYNFYKFSCFIFKAICLFMCAISILVFFIFFMILHFLGVDINLTNPPQYLLAFTSSSNILSTNTSSKNMSPSNMSSTNMSSTNNNNEDLFKSKPSNNTSGALPPNDGSFSSSSNNDTLNNPPNGLVSSNNTLGSTTTTTKKPFTSKIGNKSNVTTTNASTSQTHDMPLKKVKRTKKLSLKINNYIKKLNESSSESTTTSSSSSSSSSSDSESSTTSSEPAYWGKIRLRRRHDGNESDSSTTSSDPSIIGEYKIRIGKKF